MADFWNDFDLKRPPLITLPTKNSAFVRRVQAAITEYLKRDVDQQKEFEETAALLSRLMARRKNSFRKMAGFRTIQKLNAALCRLLRVDLKREIELLNSALPDVIFDEEALFEVEVPSRSNLDFVLVRLIGVHAIHERVQQCCIEAADYFVKMIRMCFFLETNTLLIAVFAKLRKLSIYLGNKCVELYSTLLLHRDYLPERSRHQFLPNHIELPQQLNTFKDGSENDENAPKTIDNFECNNMEVNYKTPTITKPKQHNTKKLDIGESVQREQNTLSENIMQHLKTIESIEEFIATENAKRKKSSPGSVTKNILAHEWLGIQKLFVRKMKEKQHKKAISIFTKFLSSKI